MSEVVLGEFVAEMAAKFGVPGAAVGVWVDGREVFAAHGVTSIESLVPADRDTMFVLGSVSKTFTATALMRRFAVGHNRGANGALTVAREWKDTRANNPGGGIASSVADQLRWARFQLGDGGTENGERVMPAEALARMKEQTVELQGSSLGDAFGICWFLRDVDGARIVSHGGSSNGQFAELVTVPERNFAITVMSNAGPDDGIQFNQAVVRWALEHYLRLIDKDPEALPFDPARAEEIVGDYEIDAMTLTIGTDETGLIVSCLRNQTRGPRRIRNRTPPGPSGGRSRPAARQPRRIHRHQRRTARSARFLHPRRERPDRGRRHGGADVQPGRYHGLIRKRAIAGLNGPPSVDTGHARTQAGRG